MSQRWRKASVAVERGAVPQAHSWPCNLGKLEEVADTITSWNTVYNTVPPPDAKLCETESMEVYIE